MSSPLWAVITTLALLLAAVATGHAVLRLLRVTAGSGERVLYALGVGVGVQSVLLLVCSVMGWMHPAILWAVVLVPAVIWWRELHVLRELAQRATELSETVTPLERYAAVGVGAAVVAVLAVGALVPVTDWDSLMYHIRIPRQILEVGRLHLPPDGNHLAFLGLFQFLYLPLLAVGAATGAALLNAAFTAVLGFALLVAGARVFSLQTGLLAATAVWGSSSLLLVGATPRVDVALATILALTHLAALRSWDDDAPWAIPVAAILGGVALGMKYHALPYLAAVAPILAWGAWRQTRQPRRVLMTLVGAAALFAAVATPWMLKNIAFFDAPFYPFFTVERVPPFIAEISGSMFAPEHISREALRGVGRARESINLEALIFRPAELSVELEATQYTRNPLFALLPLLLLFVRDLRLLALVLPALAYLTFTFGYFNRTNLRYVIPALPMLALSAAEIARRLSERYGGGRQWRTVLVVLSILVTLPALRVGYQRLVSVERVRVATGTLPPEALLQQDVPYVVAEYFTDSTPPDAKILMLWDARGYHFTRTVLQDNLLTNWLLLQGIGATERCLAGTGITHVYVNLVAPAYYERRGLKMNELGWGDFPAFAARCLEPMAVLPTLAIYRVR